MFNKKLITITEKIMKDVKNHISYEEACEVSALPVDDTIDIIMCANKIRTKYKKNNIFTCSIINAKSGFCSEDCAFCAQSAHHKTEIDTYPMLSEEELVDNAVRMYEASATKYSMVTSGYMLTDEEIKTISRAAAIIKKKTDLMICASLGMLTEPMARRLKEGGITTYHHNLETARSYFDRICTTHDYDADVQTVEFARSTGLKVCCGGILGLGETWEQRIELAFTLKELDVDIIPLNFLNPVPGTRLENMSLLSPLEALKSIALFRFINPEKDITICGGREVVLRDYQSWTFTAGANGLMIGDYLTTQGRNAEMDINMIKEMGII
ncbi:MAG: biotin synthase BioB [Thermodesulfobacteriota bacterium]|nr:biotin synthase BioB [Thermodesulfobacteriota bacterium]